MQALLAVALFFALVSIYFVYNPIAALFGWSQVPAF